MSLVSLLLLVSLSFNAVIVVNDDASLLTVEEANYFNNNLKKVRGDFDFTDKKTLFMSGNFGTKIITKAKYFETWGNNDMSAMGPKAMNQMLVFSENEKQQIGYDVVVIAWSKAKLKDYHKSRIIQAYLGSDSE